MAASNTCCLYDLYRNTLLIKDPCLSLSHTVCLSLCVCLQVRKATVSPSASGYFDGQMDSPWETDFPFSQWENRTPAVGMVTVAMSDCIRTFSWWFEGSTCVSWRWRVERAALASIPFTFPSGRGLPLCSWLHMAQRCPSGPWQPLLRVCKNLT